MGLCYLYVMILCLLCPVLKHVAMKKHREKAIQDSDEKEDNVQLFSNDQELLRYLCVTFVIIAFWTFCGWIPFFPFPDVFFAILISFILQNPQWSDILYTSVLEPLAISQESNVASLETMTRTFFTEAKSKGTDLISQYRVPLNQAVTGVFPWVLNQLGTVTNKPRSWLKKKKDK